MKRAILILSVSFSACAAPGSHGFLPTPERARYAVIEAACDPCTWGPIAGGLVLDASAFDEELASDVARTPFFDDPARAADCMITAL